MSLNQSFWSGISRPFWAIAMGLLVSAALVAWVGESPLAVASIFYSAVFGSSYGIGMTIFYALPLACAGLAVSVGLRSGLFNIGVEGQLTAAAFAAAVAGLYGPDDPWLNRCLGLLAALVAGFLWAAILGYLRAKRQAHEVVAGIMLNFIAYGLTSWLALNFFRNQESQNPETSPIAQTVLLPLWKYFEPAPLGWHLILVLFAAGAVAILYRWTRLGYSLEAAGAANDAAEHAGMSLPKLQFWALSLGGLIAALVGFIEVFGNSGRFVVGFSPGFGFTGIAVALIGRTRPLGVLAAALLFGALHIGSLDLDFETEWITRDFAQILQALLILFMSCSTIIPVGLRRRIDLFFRRLRGNPA